MIETLFTRIDPIMALLMLGIIGLFRYLLKAKDDHIAELRETIRYQRSLSEVAGRIAHGAVGAVERLAQ